jgi:hypothetical protein
MIEDAFPQGYLIIYTLANGHIRMASNNPLGLEQISDTLDYVKENFCEHD